MHQVWILDPEGWDTIGEPVNERQAVEECKAWREHGYKVKALPVGVRPGEVPPASTPSPTVWHNAT